MSHIDDLIAKYCPEGVEYRTLGEVGRFIRGNGLQKKDLYNEGVPAVHYGQIHTLYGVWTDHAESSTSPELASRLRRAQHGDLLIATTSEDDEAVAKATAWLGDGEVVVSGDAYIYQHSLDPKYISYYFQSQQFQCQKRKHISGTKVRRISGNSLAKILVPVPPLEIQRAIVEVLDKFSKLESELESELEARKLQYECYAEVLLSVESDMTRVRLGEVATIVRGASPRPIQRFLTDDPLGVPWIRIGDVPPDKKYIVRTSQRVNADGAAKSRRVKPGDFILSNSMSFGRPYISRIEGCIHDGWLAISGFEEVCVSDYLYHLLRSKAVQDEFKRRAGSGTVRNLNADTVRSVEIPIPPRKVQEQIAALLDQFDALVNDLSVGLPAELAARRQQYEYYRDKLLTFKELEEPA